MKSQLDASRFDRRKERSPLILSLQSSDSCLLRVEKESAIKMTTWKGQKKERKAREGKTFYQMIRSRKGIRDDAHLQAWKEGVLSSRAGAEEGAAGMDLGLDRRGALSVAG